ncbi:MAG: hypothetical protein JKY13_00775, partial [Gammaproteobacteria bacterium]|nr:hypothetical protein [Gammaproteobacteria bacterium]
MRYQSTESENHQSVQQSLMTQWLARIISITAALVLAFIIIHYFNKQTVIKAPLVQRLSPQSASVSTWASSAPPFIDKVIVVQSGDNLSSIFKRLGLTQQTLQRILSLGKVIQPLLHIKAKDTVKFILLAPQQKNARQQLQRIILSVSALQTLVVDKTAQGFSAKIINKPITLVNQFASATINRSLFAAGQKVHIPYTIMSQLANIFAWDVDFARNLRKNDHFMIEYQAYYIHDKQVGAGKIIVAQFVNRVKTYYAIQYCNGKQQCHYYDKEGYSIRKAFLRSPVKYSRISSHFSNARMQPVLHIVRRHEGTDYAAPYGTPIHATSSG